MLYEADSAAILLLTLLYEADSAAILLLILLYEADDAAIHQLGIYRGAAKNSGDANHVVYYDEIKTASSCKKINLKKLGYSCKDL